MSRATATGVETRHVRLDDDIDELTALFESVFQRPAHRDVWRWKYLPPWCDEPRGLVGCLDGRIIGHVGIVPLRGRVDGVEVPFHQLTDIMIHPEQRARLRWIQTARDAALDAARRMQPPAVVYGIADERRAGFYRQLGGTVRRDEARNRVFRATGGSAATDVEVVEWDFDRAPLDRVSREQGHTIGAALVRDGLYLRWRYRLHPSHRHRLFGVLRDGVAIGWFVTQAPEGLPRGAREINVLDLLVPEPHLAGALDALTHVLRIAALRFWLPSRLHEEWNETTSSTWFVLHRPADDPGAATAWPEFHYSLGEADEWWW